MEEMAWLKSDKEVRNPVLSTNITVHQGGPRVVCIFQMRKLRLREVQDSPGLTQQARGKAGSETRHQTTPPPPPGHNKSLVKPLLCARLCVEPPASSAQGVRSQAGVMHTVEQRSWGRSPHGLSPEQEL